MIAFFYILAVMAGGAVACLILLGLMILAWTAVFDMPSRYADAVVTGFAWRRRVDIGIPRWAQMHSSMRPNTTSATRGLCENPRSDDSRYTWEELVWRKTRHVTASGAGQESPQWPDYILAPGEQVQRETGCYRVMVSSAEGKRYKARVGLDEWQSLKMGGDCRLGRNIFGRARTVTSASALTTPGPSAG